MHRLAKLLEHKLEEVDSVIEYFRREVLKGNNTPEEKWDKLAQLRDEVHRLDTKLRKAQATDTKELTSIRIGADDWQVRVNSN